MKTIRTIFIGTSAEGSSSLEELARHPLFDVTAVLTQPDKPAGRKRKLQPTPINQTAQKLRIPVMTSGEAKDIYAHVLKKFDPQLAVVIAFGNFLPEHFLDALPYKCINIHYSLLPLLRGAVPVQKAILKGHTETGVSLQIMEESMDTGPIIAQDHIAIDPDETTPTLKSKLIPAGKKLLLSTLPGWVGEEINPQPQDHTKATYCYIDDISKQSAQIMWDTMDPVHIERMVRALLPWPVAWTFLPNGKRLKIYSAELVSLPDEISNPGSILERTDGTFFASHDSGIYLKALEVQQEGKKLLSGKDFKQGYTE